MGHPKSTITFGVPQASGDGRLYTRYPQGDAPNSAGAAQGAGATATVTAASGSATGGSSGDSGVVKHYNFTNMANGATLQSVPGASGFTWGSQGSGAYAGGSSGCYGDTSVKRSGKNSSLRMSILSGSTGRPSDGAHPQEGDFGFGTTYSNMLGSNPVQGDYVRIGAWLYFPSDFSFLTSSGSLKFLRSYRQGAGSMELQPMNGLENGSTPVGNQFGWKLIWEGQFVGPENDRYMYTSAVLPKGEWVWYEEYMYLHSSTSQSIYRATLNDTLIMEHTGTGLKFRNSSGTYTTRTLVTPVANLPSPSSYLSSLLVFTYWNGGAPKNQSVWLSDLVVALNADSQFSATDNLGNKIIGTSFV